MVTPSFFGKKFYFKTSVIISLLFFQSLDNVLRNSYKQHAAEDSAEGRLVLGRRTSSDGGKHGGWHSGKFIVCCPGNTEEGGGRS